MVERMVDSGGGKKDGRTGVESWEMPDERSEWMDNRRVDTTVVARQQIRRMNRLNENEVELCCPSYANKCLHFLLCSTSKATRIRTA